MMIFASVYSIVVGVAMIAQWTSDIVRRRVPSPEDDPVSGRGFFDMLFHWIAEFITAFILIVAVIGLILGSTWGLTAYLVAMGMLIYTAINSSGFFAQQHKWSMVGVFAVILILAVISLILVL
jgi:hypothetical protein